MNKKCCDSCGASEFRISGHNELECEYCKTRYEVEGVNDSSNYGFSSAGTACAIYMPSSSCISPSPMFVGDEYQQIPDDDCEPEGSLDDGWYEEDYYFRPTGVNVGIRGLLRKIGAKI